ncbi:TonB-dependent receptor [Sphingobacterium oryzagri]|uniref:TonB-dependent receptor n=1 Tax=Sphingobacterium oryzagri TaxID=3025669 RepID=A0ABY7WLG6_9SPHI|nr:TonB-dependent receptor [Sphingobacterium sp. KACC 22765]WDF69253.1 TonB-dependent receptor [Sphingobacterium sp. KACC 22765]
MSKHGLVTIAFCFIALCTFAQNRLTVTVQDLDQKPVAGATVELSGTVKSTDDSGKITFTDLRVDNTKLTVRHLGYATYQKSVTLQPDGQLIVTLQQDYRITGEVFVMATRATENSATTYKNLSKEDLQRTNLGQDIPFLLDQTPSVVVGSDAGAGIGYTNMTIRGSNSQRINVTLNGIPLNDAESMGSFFVNLPDFASSTESIQIQRGIGTSTNGPGAFGASLNIQSDALESDPYAELNNTFGSFNTWKNTVKVGSGLIQDKFAFNTRLSRISSDGYIDRASSDLKSFYFDAGYYGKKHQLKATIFSGREKTYQAWDGVPEELLETNRRYNGFTYDNQTDNYTQTHHHLHYNYFASDRTTLNVALHYTRGKGYYEEYRAKDPFADYGLTPIVLGSTVIDSTELIRQRWLDNHFYGTVFSLNHQINDKHSLILGGAANQYVGDHFGQIVWAQYPSNSAHGDRYYFNDAKKNDVNFYGKWNGRFGAFNLYTDLQYRYVDYTFEGYDHNQQLADINVKHHFFNPKLGVTYVLSPNSNLYTSYAFGNKEPVRDDYVASSANARPKAEKMHNIEAGYRLRNDRFNIGANVYGMFYKDQLILTGEINDVGGSIRENVPDSYRIGLELDAAWKISQQLVWKATAGLSENKIKNYTEYLVVWDENWNPIPDAPQVMQQYASTNISFSPSVILSNEFSYSPIKPFELSLASKYVSRQYLDNTSALARSVNPFFVNNVRLRYGFSLWGIQHVDANLAINNIFDEKYESHGYTYSGIAQDGTRMFGNAYYPQAGTNFLLGLNIRF